MELKTPILHADQPSVPGGPVGIAMYIIQRQERIGMPRDGEMISLPVAHALCLANAVIAYDLAGGTPAPAVAPDVEAAARKMSDYYDGPGKWDDDCSFDEGGRDKLRAVVASIIAAAFGDGK